MTETPFLAWSGPRQAKIVMVGEAWGETESRWRKPFVGSSGQELFRMLLDAGFGPESGPELAQFLHPRFGDTWINRREAFLAEAQIGLTNVLNLRPPGNKIEALCYAKSEVPKGYSWPYLARGQYLRSEFLPELARLFEELAEARPNLIIALGNTACWALLRATNISAIRGTICEASGHADSAWSGWRVKLLPTFHPAGVMRQWSWRPIVLADLIKAKREAEFPEIRRPKRQVLVNPTLEECQAWVDNCLRSQSSSQNLACDIETGAGQIKCVGFARSEADALVIPFVDLSLSTGSYWPDAWQERSAWGLVGKLLSSGIALVFQNGLYDLQYLLRMGFRPANLAEDTMLLHHSLYPEMQKGLGFLGSIYTNESSWKLLRRIHPDSEKRDE